MLTEYLIFTFNTIATTSAILTALLSNAHIRLPIFEETWRHRLMTCMLMVRLLVAVAEAPAGQAEVLRIW